MHKIFKRLLEKIGINRAVSWTLLTQAFRLFTGPASMFLMIRYLDVETQGFAYAFGSVLAISIFLEMGFSQNILQFASHEFASLEFAPNGSLRGDPKALSRIMSLGKLAFKYYGIAALIFFLVLSIGGRWFFHTSNTSGISWEGPWMLVSITSAISLLLNPCWALLEGCNRVAEIEKFRFWSSLTGFFGMATGLMLGWNLYGICMTSLVSVIVTVIYLWGKWREYFKMFFLETTGPAICWKTEIWPFQWRIALSWICGYFIFSSITPIVFRLSGAKAAAQFGFALQLTRLVSNVASSWSTTRLPEFGMLVARQDWRGLSQVWRKTSLLNIMITVLGGIGVTVSMELASAFFPSLDERYAGWLVLACLALSMVIQALINCMAYYLRAFKKEPFLGLSLFHAAGSFVLISVMTWRFEIFGASLGYLLAVLFSLPFALAIFRAKAHLFREGENTGS